MLIIIIIIIILKNTSKYNNCMKYDVLVINC